MARLRTRREFLKYALVGVGSGLGWSGCAWNKINLWNSPETFLRLDREIPPDPIFRIPSLGGDRQFSGDDPLRAHGLLWSKKSALSQRGGIPRTEEKTRLVILGGGISGLVSAYLARDLKPVLIEQAPQFGGNSKGEDWAGLKYSIGAAYVATPDPESAASKLLKEIGILDQGRVDHQGEGSHILYGKKWMAPFWEGVSDPLRAHEFKRVYQFFEQVREKQFPSIPPQANEGLSLEQFEIWDRMTFREWSEKNLGKLHPHVEEFFEQYCWSSFAAGMEELSAAQALNFIVSDVAGLVAFPGGNSAISQRIYDLLRRDLPDHHLRPSCICVDVALEGDQVRVTYEEKSGKLRSILAERCVIATPKFIARKLIDQLPEEQSAAMARIRYRSYVVANLLLKKKLASPSFDVFRLVGEPIRDRKQDSLKRPFTDVILGTWAEQDRHDRSVLTLYQPYPFEGGRALLYEKNSFESVSQRFKESLPEILSAFSLTQDDIAELRLTRWGHPIPVAEKGLISDQVFQKASRPIANRIFFAQQDNWGNPAFETACQAAHEAWAQIKKSI